MGHAGLRFSRNSTCFAMDQFYVTRAQTYRIQIRICSVKFTMYLPLYTKYSLLFYLYLSRPIEGATNPVAGINDESVSDFRRNLVYPDIDQFLVGWIRNWIYHPS